MIERRNRRREWYIGEPMRFFKLSRNIDIDGASE